MSIDQYQAQNATHFSFHLHFPLFSRRGEMNTAIQELKLWSDGYFVHCLPFNQVTLEGLVFWLVLIRFIRTHNNNHQNNPEHGICDAVTLCEYIRTFIAGISNGDVNGSEEDNRWCLQVMVEILYELDMDEFGNDATKQFAAEILLDETAILSETTVSILVKCAAKSVQPSRFGRYYVGILQCICNQIPSINEKINEMVQMVTDSEKRLAVTQLKSQIMELQEREIELIESDMPVNIRRDLSNIRIEMRALRQQIIDICSDFDTEISLDDYELSKQDIIKILQIFQYVCHSIPRMTRTSPDIALFYRNVIHGEYILEN